MAQKLFAGWQFPCSRGKYLALLLYSQASLYCKPTHGRNCQELPVPLPSKSFNRGFNLLNESDIDSGRAVRFESSGWVDSNLWKTWNRPSNIRYWIICTLLPVAKVISAAQPWRWDSSSISVISNHSYDGAPKLLAKIMWPTEKKIPLITKQISCLAHPQKSQTQPDARLCLSLFTIPLTPEEFSHP